MSYCTFFLLFISPLFVQCPLFSLPQYATIPFSLVLTPLSFFCFIFYRLVEISDESRATVAAAIVKGVKLSIVGTAAEALDM